MSTEGDLWLELPGGREIYLPRPSSELLTAIAAIDPEPEVKESKSAFLDRVSRQVGLVLKTAKWTSRKADAPGVNVDELMFCEVRDILIAVMNGAVAAPLAVVQQHLIRHIYGRQETWATLTMAELKRIAREAEGERQP